MTWYRITGRIGYTVGLIVCVVGIILAILKQQSISGHCTNSQCSIPLLPNSKTPQTVEQLQQLAQAITVKISSQQLPKTLLGSGTIVKQKNNIYTVITNAHVLRSAKPPYQIHTSDGRIYNSFLLSDSDFTQDDLAILQFYSPGVVYPMAKIANISSLSVGDQVFVGGFIPKNTANQVSQAEVKTVENNWYQFVFTSGKVSLLLTKPLVGGYQIGYTNDVRKGMSGAPLLNIYGEVVGINSLKKDPLWDTPEVYQDGSEPEPKLEKLIIDSSMAVPIKKELLLQNFQENKS